MAKAGPTRSASRFLTDTADQARLPVLLLGGFLGSGKTTLVNRLLRDPRLAGTAVAVNEFGEVPLDQHLIDHGADRTVVMANGCLCCNLAGDLEDAVLRVFSRREGGTIPRFDRLIIEPSGLADPAPIVQAILRNPVLSRVLRLDAIVATVDCVFAETQLDRHPEARKQVAMADRLVLTKTDLVDAGSAERVRALLRRHNPIATLHAADADAATLLPPEFLGATAATGARTPFPACDTADAGHAAATDAVSLVTEAPLRWAAFDAWLRGVRLAHAEQLLRVKGILNVAGTAGPVVIHGVHHVVHTPVELDVWPDADRRSRVVLITQGVPAGTIRASWDAALPALMGVQ